MNKIKYVEGDATAPQGEGKKLIIHVCNDIGVWGGGFVLAVSKKWSLPFNIYQAEYNSVGLQLGQASIIDVGDDISVANMIGQHRVSPGKDGRPPVRYGAIELCLEEVAKYALKIGATVHAPRFGAGIAGGDWDKIEKLIYQELIDVGVHVTIYDLPAPPPKQVIVMRRQFPDGKGGMRKLRTGKMIAQGAHASMAPIINEMEAFSPDDVGYEGNYNNTLGLFDMNPAWVDWINGRFTKIVVSVDTEEELLEIHRQAEVAKLPCALITDAGLTEFDGVPTYTAVGIGPARAAEIDKITSHLPLM